jgi:hypothetical protein
VKARGLLYRALGADVARDITRDVAPPAAPRAR